MIRGQIILTFKSGIVINYANKKLADKSGNDGEENLLHKGLDCFYYCYTGSGTDKYDNQTGTGKIKGDFEYFVEQIGGTGLLKFPEDSNTTELVRKSSITSKPYNRISIKAEDLISVAVEEEWITYPDENNREAGYQLPKDSPNFAGYQETKDIKDRGPNWNNNKNYDDGFIPRPILKISDGTLIIENENEYDNTVAINENGFYYVYGIKNNKKSATSVIKK